MASSRKTSPAFVVTIIVLGALAGSLAWELVERLLALPFSLATGPIQLFDLYVAALTVRANPGTFVGGAAAALLARQL